MEWIKQHTGIKIDHVAYKSTPELLVNIVSGEIPIGWVDVISPIKFIADGKLKGIAITGTQRAPKLPEIKTLSEQGYPFTATGWQAVFAPKGTPEKTIAKIHQIINSELENPSISEALAKANVPKAQPGSRNDLIKIIQDDLATWKEVTSKSNILKD